MIFYPHSSIYKCAPRDCEKVEKTNLSNLIYMEDGRRGFVCVESLLRFTMLSYAPHF